MARNLTPSQENYLEHILRLSREGPVRVRGIAQATGVKLPSVTRALNRLGQAGMVSHQAYGTCEITAAGIRAARFVVRRDDCLRRLLVEILAMEYKEAEVEICRLEHMLSDKVLRRLEILVDYL